MSDSHITDDWLEVESAASVMSLDSLPSDDEVQVDDDDHAPILPAKPSPPASAPAKKAPPPAYSPAKEPSLPVSAPAKETSLQNDAPAPQQRIPQKLGTQQQAPHLFDAPIPHRPAPAPMAIPTAQQPNTQKQKQPQQQKQQHLTQMPSTRQEPAKHLLDTPIPDRLARAPMTPSDAQQFNTQHQRPFLDNSFRTSSLTDTLPSEQSNSQQHQTKRRHAREPPVYPTQSPPLPAESMAIPHPPASDALEPRAPWSFTDPLSEPDIYSATDAESPPRPDFGKENEANVNDPSYYYKSLCAASISLDATIEKATQLGASRVSTLSFLKSACEDLAKHIGDLKPILAVYAERWQAKGSGMAAGEMPVNASLLEWITTLRTQLHNAQTEMNRIRNPPRHDPRLEAEDSRHLSAKQIPLYLNVALAGCTEALEDTLTTIEEFMPIFKADFDESQTRWMSMPPKETENLNPTPSLKRSRPDFPHPDITRIRRELYSLKDQVRRGHVFLTTIYETIPRPPLPEAPAVLETMDSIIEAISTILTNHASEWIESGYSTSRKIVIPYHEFVALDPDMIHDITGHLQELQDQLEVGEDQLVGQHSPEVVRNHQLVLLTECGQLGEIVSILDLLKSLLLGRDSPTHV